MLSSVQLLFSYHLVHHLSDSLLCCSMIYFCGQLLALCMLGRDSVRLLALLICLALHFGSVVPHSAPEVTTFFWRQGFMEPTTFIESTTSIWARLSSEMAASALDKLETFDPHAETFERYG